MYRFSVIPKRILQISKKNYYFETVSKKHSSIEDMPHPKGLPVIGTKLDLFRAGGGTNLHEYVNLRHKELGPIFYEILEGNQKLVFISDPNLMKSLFLNLEGKYPAHILPEPWVLYERLYGSKRGLFFMDGEEWLSNRRIMNKYLLREESDNWLIEPIKHTINKFVQNWLKRLENGSYVPKLEEDFYRLSLDVILAILVGNHGNFNASNHYETLLMRFSDSVKKIFLTTTKLYGLPVHWFYRLNLKAWTDFKECVDTSIFFAQKIVREILKEKQDNGLIKNLANENISEETLIRIVADFIIAAGDTTAYTSMWILYLLSKNSEVAQEVVEKDAYGKYVIKEAMRLYPVAPFLTRILQKESLLGSFQLKEGTPIIASIYTSGRDEANFTRPNEFLPYRWDRQDPRRNGLLNHNPTASLPFAFGARSCVGKKIAVLQLNELINQITKNFRIKCMNKTEVKAITSQILVPKEAIELCFTYRN